MHTAVLDPINGLEQTQVSQKSIAKQSEFSNEKKVYSSDYSKEISSLKNDLFKINRQFTKLESLVLSTDTAMISSMEDLFKTINALSHNQSVLTDKLDNLLSNQVNSDSLLNSLNARLNHISEGYAGQIQDSLRLITEINNSGLFSVGKNRKKSKMNLNGGITPRLRRKSMPSFSNSGHESDSDSRTETSEDQTSEDEGDFIDETEDLTTDETFLSRNTLKNHKHLIHRRSRRSQLEKINLILEATALKSIENIKQLDKFVNVNLTLPINSSRQKNKYFSAPVASKKTLKSRTPLNAYSWMSDNDSDIKETFPGPIPQSENPTHTDVSKNDASIKKIPISSMLSQVDVPLNLNEPSSNSNNELATSAVSSTSNLNCTLSQDLFCRQMSNTRPIMTTDKNLVNENLTEESNLIVTRQDQASSLNLASNADDEGKQPNISRSRSVNNLTILSEKENGNTKSRRSSSISIPILPVAVQGICPTFVADGIIPNRHSSISSLTNIDSLDVLHSKNIALSQDFEKNNPANFQETFDYNRNSPPSTVFDPSGETYHNPSALETIKDKLKSFESSRSLQSLLENNKEKKPKPTHKSKYKIDYHTGLPQTDENKIFVDGLWISKIPSKEKELPISQRLSSRRRMKQIPLNEVVVKYETQPNKAVPGNSNGESDGYNSIEEDMPLSSHSKVSSLKTSPSRRLRSRELVEKIIFDPSTNSKSKSSSSNTSLLKSKAKELNNVPLLSTRNRKRKLFIDNSEEDIPESLESDASSKETISQFGTHFSKRSRLSVVNSSYSSRRNRTNSKNKEIMMKKISKKGNIITKESINTMSQIKSENPEKIIIDLKALHKKKKSQKRAGENPEGYPELIIHNDFVYLETNLTKPLTVCEYLELKFNKNYYCRRLPMIMYGVTLPPKDTIYEPMEINSQDESELEDIMKILGNTPANCSFLHGFEYFVCETHWLNKMARKDEFLRDSVRGWEKRKHLMSLVIYWKHRTIESRRLPTFTLFHATKELENYRLFMHVTFSWLKDHISHIKRFLEAFIKERSKKSHPWAFHSTQNMPVLGKKGTTYKNINARVDKVIHIKVSRDRTATKGIPSSSLSAPKRESRSH
ncbi:hypothetical protein TBLA_0C03470 [Henningerozyma blattae CBS 6284]|uniref:Uncharacterized protein n=1 Tax=Henningerozyma blattae (strain ATCC 34711 / CBS 6284 / DSM 70876 / NBRC 10599 / NRRL Y-10934 / UCD 77-7) TaxID=1071380 RepID=I2H198_HENB6|nr:hypothetical protein TBLA_0C03470 [Tetrapisispora blattae CBS 6284]CCH60150.1 hypothetical protein TBLA_0C03470 [Tetrapisispora blattae CBS 6284]